MPLSFTDGSEIIERSPSSAFDVIRDGGFKIIYQVDDEVVGIRELVVQVQHGDQIIAKSDFSDGPQYAHAQNIVVEEKYRRRGIANAMYVFAETFFGNHLTPLWDDDEHSAGAEALWTQQNRPFGNPPRNE